MSINDDSIDRILEGEASQEEAAEFQRWLKTSANLKRFAFRAELHSDLRRSLRRRHIQTSAIEASTHGPVDDLASSREKPPTPVFRSRQTLVLTVTGLVTAPGPLDIGFDYHFAVPQNHGDASGVYVRNRQVVGLRSDRNVPAGKSPYGRNYMGIDAPRRVDENVMDELTTDALEWLEKQAADTPFFLYFAPVAIHFPYTPSEKTKGDSGTGLYGDWIHELDLSVGRILDTIDQMKATEETLVIFTSDNGGVLMTEGTRPEAEAYRAGLRPNGHWRGRKHSIYEGGFRVPFLVRWPGRVQPGTVSDETINLVDIYATIAKLIDHPISRDENVAEDSFNVLPAILGTPPEKPLRSSMVLHSPNGNFAIRRGPWKFVEGKPSPTLLRVPRKDELHAQLYNLHDDSGEQNNVINDHPDIVKRLSELLEKQRADGRSSPRTPQQNNVK